MRARSENTVTYSVPLTSTKRFSPLWRNTTVPGRVAKIVSSRPMPVPSPGRNFVPRWRTRIIPAFTSWPEKIFTPSIFGFESRPLRDDPSPFLCAIPSLTLLCFDHCFERRDCALSLRVLALVRERSFRGLELPPLRLLRDFRH